MKIKLKKEGKRKHARCRNLGREKEKKLLSNIEIELQKRVMLPPVYLIKMNSFYKKNRLTGIN